MRGAVIISMLVGSALAAEAVEAILMPGFNRPLAESEQGWRWSVRPQAGVGVSSVGSYHRGESVPWGISELAGMRLLLGPDAEKRAGIEATWLHTGLAPDEGLRNAVLVGPVAEVRVWRVVHLEVGGFYAQQIEGDRHGYADVMYGVGLAPSRWGAQSPWTSSLSYRSELIFSTRPVTVRSLILGLHYAF